MDDDFDEIRKDRREKIIEALYREDWFTLRILREEAEQAREESASGSAEDSQEKSREGSDTQGEETE